MQLVAVFIALNGMSLPRRRIQLPFKKRVPIGSTRQYTESFESKPLTWQRNHNVDLKCDCSMEKSLEAVAAALRDQHVAFPNRFTAKDIPKHRFRRAKSSRFVSIRKSKNEKKTPEILKIIYRPFYFFVRS